MNVANILQSEPASSLHISLEGMRKERKKELIKISLNKETKLSNENTP